MPIFRSLLFALLLGAALLPAQVFAEADGPDFFRVTGVAAEDVLNIRAAPDAAAARIGTVPADGDGLQNRGCQGGLSFAEWQAATESERQAAARTRWCRITYQGTTGWVAGWFLAESAGAPVPSFDCARAASGAETAICGNPWLARLDVELSRLFALATADPGISEVDRDVLKAAQRGWIKGRDACWQAGEPLDTCIAASYVLRIDALRTEQVAARADDAAGLSLGPFAYVCEGLDAPVSVVIANADPGILSLRWGADRATPVQQPSGSGSLYEASLPEGSLSFFMKGREALLTFPAGNTFQCRQDEPG
jgi:uncharacterized protein